MTDLFDKSSKIQLLSQATIIGIFTFMLITFVIPAINANSEDIEEIKISVMKMDVAGFDEKLNNIDVKLDKIVLGMCGEFGGKYCE